MSSSSSAPMPSFYSNPSDSDSFHFTPSDCDASPRAPACEDDQAVSEVAKASAPGLSEAVMHLGAVLRLVSDPRSALFAELEGLQHAMDLLKVRHPGDLAGAVSDLQKEAAALRKAVDQGRAREEDLEEKLRAGQTRAEELKEELRAGKTRAEELEEELRAAETREEDLEEELRATEAREQELEAKLRLLAPPSPASTSSSPSTPLGSVMRSHHASSSSVESVMAVTWGPSSKKYHSPSCHYVRRGWIASDTPPSNFDPCSFCGGRKGSISVTDTSFNLHKSLTAKRLDYR